MKSFKITQSITDRTDMSLNIFFKDISKIPLIDANKEIELAQRAKKGDKKAANELVSSHLRFVVSVAKQYQNKGLPLVDLIQSGVEGALRAIDLYNPNKGIKFISYAVWWIRQSIILSLSNECRTVRVPTNQINYNSRINKAINKFEQEHQRKPSNEEIEEDTNLTSEQINLAMSSISKSMSLDTPFKDDEVGTIGDIIPNKNAILPGTELESKSTYDEIESILSEFSNRESDIVRMSFGIGMDNMTYEEIAARFGIGEERVRQILQSTLKKLKHLYGNRLRELL